MQVTTKSAVQPPGTTMKPFLTPFLVTILHVLIVCTSEEVEPNYCRTKDCLDPNVPIHWDLVGLDQNDPKLIEAIKNQVLWAPPKNKKLALERPTSAKRIGGQYGQSTEIEALLKKHKLLKTKKSKRQGFYIEAGACNGETISNTLLFEIKHNWTGLLVEPNPDFFEDLKRRNRNAWILPHCLSTQRKVEIVEFDASFYNGGIILPGKVLPSDISRAEKRYTRHDFERTIKVQCFPLQSVLKAIGQTKVDYFSLDIEGAEYPVLKSIEYDQIDIGTISVEVNHAGKIFGGSREDIEELLEENGYTLAATVQIDDIFMKKKLLKT